MSENELEEVVVRTPDGRLVTGKKLSFKVKKEEWNEYELEDGTKLYIKLVLADVVRLDELNAPVEEPIYQISTQNIIRVKASKKAVEEVKKKIKKKSGSPEVS